MESLAEPRDPGHVPLTIGVSWPLEWKSNGMSDVVQSPAPSGDREKAFRAEVASRFGLVPNFFQTAGEAPGLIAELWGFAKSAYLDNPLPSLFKERLFVHLSRFCEVRYCIVRHVGFLIGEGNPSGDPDATPESIAGVVDLLRRPGPPEAEEVKAALGRLSSYREPLSAMPEPGSEAEWDLFTAATLLFLNPMQGDRARRVLRKAIGSANLELLTAHLAFIHMAHFWTQTHPEIPFEEDMERLLRQHEELGFLLLNRADGERSQIGTRLFEELETLRSEHDDRVALRESLKRNEEAKRHQDLLINELNHRVKNTLAIIQSIAAQTLRGDDVPSRVRDAFTARLVALAEAHDVLTRENWESAELEDVLTITLGMQRQGGKMDRITVKGPRLRLMPRPAVALAMASHELATNATMYGALSNDTGRIEVRWDIQGAANDQRLRLTWTETGGPPVTPPSGNGFGSRLIERGLAAELQGTARLDYRPEGVVATIEAPLPVIAAPA